MQQQYQIFRHTEVFITIPYRLDFSDTAQHYFVGKYSIAF